MKVVIQRVKHASVKIINYETQKIGLGLLILVGIHEDDTEEDVNYLTQKIVNLRIFNDSQGKMNLNIQDIEGEVLIISQFTLFASTKKGNRPSFIQAANPIIALPLYEKFIIEIKKHVKEVKTGVFAADMDIKSVNQGPVTIIIDSKNKF